MKKILLFLISLLLGWAYFANAQSVFPVSTSLWQSEEITIAGPITMYYGICGDTLIQTKEFQKVYRIADYPWLDTLFQTYVGATRVEDQKVWYLQEGLTNEVLLYDFDLEEGEEITVVDFANFPVTLTVDSVGLLPVNGQMRKTIYFTPPDQFTDQEYWIEGIGSNRGPLTRGYVPAADWDPLLVCFSDGDFTFEVPKIFIDCTLDEIEFCDIVNDTDSQAIVDGIFGIYPNPFSNYFVLDYNPAMVIEPITIKILDVQGRLLHIVHEVEAGKPVVSLNNLPAGVYFFQVIRGADSGVFKVLKQ